MPAAAARDLIRAYGRAPGFEEVNAAMRANTFSRLADIRVPVTLAWPEHDRIVARLRNPPPNVRTVILPGAGHLPMWDDPQRVAELLLSSSA
jgi:pimeloyl-ACP methyl ester carboxylesterase